MIFALIALLIVGGIPSALQRSRERNDLKRFFISQFPRGYQEQFLRSSEDWNLIPIRVGKEVFHLYSKATANGVAIFDGVHPPVHVATVPFETIVSVENPPDQKWATLKTTESEKASFEIRIALKGSVKEAVYGRKLRAMR